MSGAAAVPDDAPASPGVLVDDGTHPRLQFDRVLPHPRERVWQVLTTEPDRQLWFFAGTLDPVVGSEVRLVDSGSGVSGRVTDVVTDELLRFTWTSQDGPETVVAFHLSDATPGTEGETLLRFTHHVNEQCRLPRLCAGWHAILDDLAQYLDQERVTPRPHRHADLVEHYTDLGNP